MLLLGALTSLRLSHGELFHLQLLVTLRNHEVENVMLDNVACDASFNVPISFCDRAAYFFFFFLCLSLWQLEKLVHLNHCKQSKNTKEV